MSRHFIVDLDRTLFATGKFTPRLLAWIEQTYKIPTGTLSAEQDNYSIYVDDLRAYDLFAHLEFHSIDSGQFSARVLSSEFANDAYLFEGAAQLLDECLTHGQLSILSFGPDNYQRLKYQLCPSIVERARLVTTLVPKYQMIDTVATGLITVIDDKPIGSQLPDTAEFIQAVPELKSVPVQSWPVFNSLKDVQEHIHAKTY